METTDPDVAPWRVQWIYRRDLGEPDQYGGHFDFTTENEARAYLAGDEVEPLLTPFWRVELRYRPPWETVVTMPYRQGEEVDLAPPDDTD